jgi:hypothetical protein
VHCDYDFFFGLTVHCDYDFFFGLTVLLICKSKMRKKMCAKTKNQRQGGSQQQKPHMAAAAVPPPHPLPGPSLS